MKTIRSNLPKGASLAAHGPNASAPLGSFFVAALVGGIFMLLGSVVLAGLASTMPYSVFVGLVLYALAVIWAGNRLSADFPHATLGLCNLATLVRLVIVGILFVAVLEQLPPTWGIFALAALALGLDGVDGWLARKQGLVSDFGARFDVEVDAAFALTLAVFAAVNGAAGMYVIVLGLPYYLFSAAKLIWPWLDAPLPDKFSRKVVCVFQIAALIALQVPFLADGQLDLVIVAVTIALLWSFGRDILWLWRQSK